MAPAEIASACFFNVQQKVGRFRKSEAGVESQNARCCNLAFRGKTVRTAVGRIKRWVPLSNDVGLSGEPQVAGERVVGRSAGVVLCAANADESRERENRAKCPYSTGQGLTPQISVAYCEMVRSLENFPLLPTFKTALRANSSGSAHSCATLFWVSV